MSTFRLSLSVFSGTCALMLGQTFWALLLPLLPDGNALTHLFPSTKLSIWPLILFWVHLLSLLAIVLGWTILTQKRTQECHRLSGRNNVARAIG